MKKSFQAVLVFMLLCASMGGAVAAQAPGQNWYKQVYSGLDKSDVNQLIQALLEKEGYKVIPIKPNGNVVATEWLDAAPEEPKDGLQERRRFRSLVYSYSEEDKTAVLVLDLVKEQRSSEQAAWKNKRIDFYNNAYYRDILEQLDQRVIDAGGLATDMDD